MSDVIPDEAESEADRLRQFEASERTASELYDEATGRRRVYRWTLAALGVAAMVFELAYPAGLSGVLLSALFAFGFIMVVFAPQDSAAAYLRGYVQRGRDDIEAGRVPSEEKIEQIEAMVEQVKAKKGIGGRPRNEDDDWAWAQVNTENRDRGQVYDEWIVKIGLRLATLKNPKRSFNQATDPKKGPKPRH